MDTNSIKSPIEQIKEDSYSFEVNLTRRYYHFVVISSATELRFNDLWNIVPLKLSDKKEHSINKIIGGIEIQQRQIESKIPLRQLEENNVELKPPYYYDLFISHVNNQFILLFPFRVIAKKCVEEFLKKIKGLEFMRLNMNAYVQSNYINIAKEINEDFGTGILGVEVGIKGEDNINSVSIEGEHPLNSQFYINFLKEPIESDIYTINSINIKGSTLAASLSYPKSRARIHLDFYGNGKFYLHLAGRNVFILSLVWKSLIETKCLVPSDDNPIPRIKKD